MRDAIVAELRRHGIDTYVFSRTARGHQAVVMSRNGQTRKVFFAGGHGKDQAALKNALSFVRRMVAEIS
jgi:hypothetical protein